jgi:acetyl-CoA synthetase
MPDKAIEVLLDEKRNFPPPEQFKKSARAKSGGIFTSALKNPQAFWAKAARELGVVQPVEKSFGMEFALDQMGRSNNCLDRHVKGRCT